jgi:hypothetical protein
MIAHARKSEIIFQTLHAKTDKVGIFQEHAVRFFKAGVLRGVHEREEHRLL